MENKSRLYFREAGLLSYFVYESKSAIPMLLFFRPLWVCVCVLFSFRLFLLHCVCCEFYAFVFKSVEKKCADVCLCFSHTRYLREVFVPTAISTIADQTHSNDISKCLSFYLHLHSHLRLSIVWDTPFLSTPHTHPAIQSYTIHIHFNCIACHASLWELWHTCANA